jgi:hypothetical protein
MLFQRRCELLLAESLAVSALGLDEAIGIDQQPVSRSCD